MIILGLVQNIALLVTLSVMQQLILRVWERHTFAHRVMSGLLYGSVAIVGMMTAVVIEPGIVFDGRSIVLGIAGFFGGPVVASIAAMMAIGYRAVLGGPGTVMGVAVIIESAAIGVALYYLRKTYPQLTRPVALWVFGLVIHLIMLALTLTLPRESGLQVLNDIVLPVIVLYPVAFVIIARVMLDQEERLASERALRDSETRLRAIIEQTDQGISLGRTDGTTMPIYNPAMARISGYSRAEVEEHGWFSLVYPTEERRATALRLAAEALGGAQPYLEIPIVCKNGEERIVSFATTPVVVSGEKFNLSILTDVTEQRQSEVRLKELDEILSRSPAVAFTWEPVDGWPITFVSRSIRQFGYDAGALMQSRTQHAQLVHPIDLCRIEKEVDAHLSAGATEFDLEYRLVTPEGNERWVAERTWPTRDAKGSVAAFQGVLVDISDRKTAELELEHHRDHLEELVEERTRELQDVNRMLEEASTTKSRFLANMSHELRTPMNSIIGFSSILSQGLAGTLTEEQQKQAEMIHRSGKQLLALIDDILDLSKVEAGSVRLRHERFDPGELLQEVAESVRPMAAEKHLVIEVDAGSSANTLYSDPARVRQVLLNLAGNAVKFTAAGNVALTYRRDDDTDRFTVTDTGPGIAANDLVRIFEPFVQLDQPDTAKSRGTGLGLSICQQYARLLGGEISVRSELGVGSEFTLSLPVSPEGSAQR